jgi:pilus assembly protein Flp/PilA
LFATALREFLKIQPPAVTTPLDPPAARTPARLTGGKTMTRFAIRFARDEAGATAIEYGLIVALIAVVIITAVTTLGTKLNTAFTSINDKLT